MTFAAEKGYYYEQNQKELTNIIFDLYLVFQ